MYICICVYMYIYIYIYIYIYVCICIHTYNLRAADREAGAPRSLEAAACAENQEDYYYSLTHSLTVAIPPGGGIGGAAHNQSVSVPVRVPSGCMYTDTIIINIIIII